MRVGRVVKAMALLVLFGQMCRRLSEGRFGRFWRAEIFGGILDYRHILYYYM
jgi:hypothetical protein